MTIRDFYNNSLVKFLKFNLPDNGNLGLDVEYSENLVKILEDMILPDNYESRKQELLIQTNQLRAGVVILQAVADMKYANIKNQKQIVYSELMDHILRGDPKIAANKLELRIKNDENYINICNSLDLIEALQKFTYRLDILLGERKEILIAIKTN